MDQSSSPKEHSASQLLEVGQLNTQVGKIYVLIDKGKRKSLALLVALAEMFCRSQRRVASARVVPHFPTGLFSLFYY